MSMYPGFCDTNQLSQLLFAANERISALEEKRNGAVADYLSAAETAHRLRDKLTAERDVSDKLTAIMADLIEALTDEGVCCDLCQQARAALAEVAAIRAKGEQG